MQRYAGELTPADDRPAIPMRFDGWDYVPLEPAAAVEKKASQLEDAREQEQAPAATDTPEPSVNR